MTAVPDTEPGAARARDVLRSSFDAAHAARFSYDMRDRPVEFLQWRMSAITPRRTDVRRDLQTHCRRLTPSRPAVLPRARSSTSATVRCETPVFDAAALAAGAIVAGPAILDSETSTIIVPPGDSLRADGNGNFLLTVG